MILLGGPALLHADALKVGDEAPDFTLETYERNDRITLSSFRGHKPVVLIFGSYT
jgi:peroxiredoxin